ncbi:lipid kinase YegS [Shimia sagamensis]|uniref:Lipid kinase YegS n=2 Tax=Shimia sagamensis TaxID=1566352 RepID=A0ABY1PBM8_9RHOB|nr:lipid kinase YegS [Shimia sagamensis]
MTGVMTHKTLLTLNGKSAARADVREALMSLQQDLDIDVWVPWNGAQFMQILERAVADGVTRVVGAGGDGTANAVCNALMQFPRDAGLSMGLVPLGTANDFARAFGDAGDDLLHSIRVAATEDATPIDVGVINGEHFVNVASGGFGAMITSTTPADVKRRLGGLAYTLSGLTRLSELHPTKARISVAGDDSFDAEITALIVGNSRFAGGGFDVAPLADVTDGLLDLALLSKESFQGGAGSMLDLVGDDDPTEAFLQRYQCSSAIIETETPFHMNLDGEPMVADRFEVSVKPQALQFVLPRKSVLLNK